ncbi:MULTISPECIES: PaaI family thioesterase [Butyricimonas]|uniref:PaaI family thioesterase n=1 Tax=Butyricimonas hominis TaxID=2763032 RepID=A0ABR7CXK1_9BACT|nr:MULTISPECIES: PaaI family thioesterase [Butyricimonas]MBC5620411.1 PaaI family thioesterase [Butyricimonas hominis]MCB6970565.1 PaaI family thioesterase [Butyricimonas synergistica]MCG4517279.1 PaaI family thioesterase [Butyricimonas sp. DFI.6.44]
MLELIEQMNRERRGTLMESLGIEFIGVGENWLEAKMPIDERTMRPGQLLHGGAIMALVETVGSGLTYIGENLEENHVFGIEINGNHIRKAQGSYVIGRAEFIHKGQRTHVVAVNVTDEFGNLASVCRITNVVLPKSSDHK